MTSGSLNEEFCTDANVEVLSFLRERNPSAHSDVAEELTRAGSSVSGLQAYCPDPPQYAFLALYLEDKTIIGLAFGMSGLAFRLPQDRVEEALRDGGTVVVELGRRWVRFEPWTDRETLEQSRHRLARWCAIAAGEPAA